MTRKVLFIVCYFTFISLGNFSNATESSQSPIDRVDTTIEALTDLDSIVDSTLKTFGIPGAAVGIVFEGEVVFAKGFGVRDLEQGLPVTENTLFAIGSCSKAFTTLVLGQLVDEGVISWDDPVINHIPEFRLWDQHATHKMTIRDLVTHRSGLPRHDYLWYNSELSRDELISRLKFLEPVNDLREKFHYSNLMYVVAGVLVERVTGMPWEDAVHSRILTPLAMTDSNFSVEISQLSDNFSLPYSERDGEVLAIPFRNISAIGPAGSINSTVIDMVKWIQLQLSDGALFEGNIIKKETLHEMHSIQTVKSEFPTGKSYSLGYGLGWGIGIYEGHYLVEHNGGIDGFVSRVALLPHDKIGVVVLTNSDNRARFVVSSVSNTILDSLLNVENVDWVEKMQEIHDQGTASEQKSDEQNDDSTQSETSLSHSLSDYVGRYEHLGYGTVLVSMQDDELMATYNRILTPLSHRHYDMFVGVKGTEDPVFTGMSFSFFNGSSGDVAELHIPLEPSVKPIVFQRQVDNELLGVSYLGLQAKLRTHRNRILST